MTLNVLSFENCTLFICVFVSSFNYSFIQTDSAINNTPGFGYWANLTWVNISTVMTFLNVSFHSADYAILVPK